MSTQPNILLVTTDHWPGALLGVAGHPVVQTPALDELAQAGTRFPQTYSLCPICMPARQTLMTGQTPRSHGLRLNRDKTVVPDVPTLASTLSQAGYQAYAVGKLHTYPQRRRLGFDDVLLDEEGRLQYGGLDDYELFLGDEGYTGQQFQHGMGNNQYWTRPWHLPEHTHVTNWAAHQMARMIKRRDPTRPAFWYLGYRHPHPPLVPLQAYLDLYRDYEIDPPITGDWSESHDWAYLHARSQMHGNLTFQQALAARRAFYALCTQIDHQLRFVIGTLREEGLLDNTVICFTADHGDMLGDHNLWAKGLFYEGSVRVPMILVGPRGDDRVGQGVVSDRLVAWEDVMPTLLDLAGVEIPDSVDGLSMVGQAQHDYLFGEIQDGIRATRMIYDGHFKLIYYANGNHRQLFDLANDPLEQHDLRASAEYGDVLERLTGLLIEQLYGEDLDWVQDGVLVGLPEEDFPPTYPNPGMFSQRGTHWPPPPPSV